MVKSCKNKLNRFIGLLLVFCMLFSQTSVFADAKADAKYVDNIAPTLSSFSLSKQRKVTVQIDQGTYNQASDTVQNKIYSILKPKLEAEKIELDVSLRSITTIDTVVNSTSFSDDSENFYVSLNNSAYTEFSDAAKSAQILNLFVEKQVAFIGIGCDSNKSQIESFISKNQGNGIYIDNKNLDSAIIRLAEYIIGRSTVSLDLLVGDGANQDKALLQSKINTIVKPKLATADIDADINLKMLKSESSIPSIPYALTTYLWNYDYRLVAYNNGTWNTLIRNDYLENTCNFKLSYDGKKMFYQIYALSIPGLGYFDLNNNSIVTRSHEGMSNLSRAVCYDPAIDGKVYFTENETFVENNINYSYSKIYSYDFTTGIKTYITETQPIKGLINEWGVDEGDGEIVDLKVSTDLKIIYTVQLDKYADYRNDGALCIPYAIGCYDINSKKDLLKPDTSNSNFSLTGNIVILADNSVIIPRYDRGNNTAVTERTNINTFGKGGTYGYTPLEVLPQLGSVTRLSSGIICSTMSCNRYIATNQTVYYINSNSNVGTLYTFKYGVYSSNGIVDPTNSSYSNESLSKYTPYISNAVNIMPNGELYSAPASFTTENGSSLSYNIWSLPIYPILFKPNIEEFNQSLQNTTFDDSKDSYVAYLGDVNVPELNHSAKKANIVSQLKKNNTKFVGMGTDSNKGQFNELVSLNNNNGTVFDNTNLDTSMNNLADYIISNAKKSSKDILNYIVVSEGSEALETQEGTLDTNGLPAYSDTLNRSNDYFDVTGGNSYTFTSSAVVNAFNIYWYDSTLQLISKNNYNQPPTNLIAPSDATYAKIVYGSSHSNVDIAVTNNTEANGDNVAYSSNVNDYEVDLVDYMYKFTHDPYKIAGVTIDNPSDKIMFNNLDISIPVKKFTKPGTYTISLVAKDKPKLINDSTNILINGDSETVDSEGKILDWSSWAANPSITTFTRAVSQELKISGNGSFEISTEQVTDGFNNAACYFKDVVVSPNTNYILSGLLKTQNCTANFDIYELDANYNIINTLSSDAINSTTPQSSSICLTTQSNTKLLRVFITKGKTTNGVTNIKDYIVADDIILSKILSDSRFEEYRKLSNPATKTIYAHRIPKADFSYKVGTKSDGSFYVTDLADNGLSYDPDHSSRADKGIIDSQWKWGQVSTDGTVTWHDGKLQSTLDFLPGSQILLWYRVRDIDGPGGKGAWSNPKMQRIDGKLAEPVAMFVPNPNPLPMQNEIELADQSYSRNVNGVITKRVWTIRKAGETTVKTLTFDREDNVNIKYYKRFTSLGFGKYTITLTVTDNYGLVSKPYSRVINVIDTINPTIAVDKTEGEFKDGNGAIINVNCKDSTQSTLYNRGLKTISYVWSKSATKPQVTDDVETITISAEKTYSKDFKTSKKEDGTWYLYIKDMDYAGNTNNNGEYERFGPYTIQMLRAGNFYITMMLDIGWRSYFFNLNNGIDDNHDGQIDRYPRRTNTDIGTLKMPINYYNLVGHDRTYIKAGYRVKGKIDIIGNPDYAEFHINYLKNNITYTDIVPLSKSTGDTYTFEWVIPLETDNMSFISFDLVTRKGNKTYGNEKWVDDTWDSRNQSRLVFYVKGKATDDLTFVQSQ